MPALIKSNLKQLTREQANLSRLVTKCRWVFEVTNAFLKSSFKALRKVYNKALDHTIDDYRIAAALINKFFRRLYSKNGIDQLMKEKHVNTTNEVQEFSQREDQNKANLRILSVITSKRIHCRAYIRK